MQRSPAPGKAGDCEVEAAPKEMYRAHLAEKAASQQLQDTIDLHEGAPVAVGSVRIVRAVHVVIRKVQRVRQLGWQIVNQDRNTDLA